MKTPFARLKDLFECNWTTVFVGWRGLGVYAPWKDSLLEFPSLLSEGEVLEECGLALSGVRESPRVGISIAGLVLSGCTSAVFDWPLLFNFVDYGGLGMPNWVLSWTMLALFTGFGVWLIAGRMRRPHRGRPTVAAVVLAGMAVLGLRLEPTGKLGG